MAFIKETGFSPGARYTVQVRARSRTDQQRVSEWSNAFTFTTSADTVPPMPPSNLEFESEGSSFIAKWDAPTQNADGTVCTDLAGYRLYFVDTEDDSVITRELFTADESFTLSFDDNKEMFGHARGKLTIFVMAVDHMGNRSDEATKSAENPPPADVTGLEVLPGIESISMSWDENTVDTDLVGYRVYASTDSKNFTPSEGNLKYSGTSTAFILPTANPVDHHVKVTAIDIFRLESVNPAYGSATPRTTTGADNTPPAEPTELDVETLIDGPRTSIKLEWVDPEDSDLSHILVRYSEDNVDWSYTQVPAGSEAVVITAVKPDTNYYVSIRAYDLSGNKSDWVNTDSYPYKTDKNLTAPNKPKTPSVLNDPNSSTSVWLTMDLVDTNNDPLVDISSVKVYRTNNSSAQPATDQLVDTIPVASGDLFISTTLSAIASVENETTRWYVVATNAYGVSSPASNLVQSQLEQLSGAHIKDASITSAKISSLSANKLEANSAFVNDLYIRSKLTIDNALGEISSSDYSAAQSKGWKIDKSGIVINDGAIRAKALEIQSSPNICLPEYSSFEFNKAMYSLSDNSVNTDTLTASINTIKVDVDADSKYGNQSLKIDWPTGGQRSITLGTASKWTASVDSLQTYIVSAYIKNSSSGTTGYRLEVDTNDGQTEQSSITTQKASDEFVRHKMIVETNANTTKIKVRVVKTTSGADTARLDGIQIERQISALEEPSNYSPPGLTSMSGEGIVTGSIRSSASAVGIPSQPAWSLNTQGNMQVGDALVRGNLTVGAGTDISNSMVKSSDYQTGVAGWMIRGDGFVEFNNGLFRSDLLLEREVDDVTLRLKASVADSIVYTPGSSTGEVVVAQPLITGQTYAFDRTLVTGGWYVPTVANKDKRMRFSIGPTTAKNLVIQTADNNVDGVYSSLPPNNVLINNVTIGEQIDYRVDPVIREKSGTELMTYRNEVYEEPVRTRSVIITPGTSYGNESYSRVRHSTDYRSPFIPESNSTQKKNSEFFTRSENIMEARSTFISPTKNLIAPPYDYSSHANSWLPFSESRTMQSGGTGELVVSNSSIVSVHPMAYSMLYDDNYKIPAWLVRFGKGSGAKSYIWLNNVSTVNASTGSVTGLQAGKTYIFSIFCRTDQGGSPTSDFRIELGLRFRNGTGTNDLVESVVVKAGEQAHRVSVAIEIPANATNVGRATPYISFPTRQSTTGSQNYRDIALSRPQIELKTWGNHEDPEIANSNAPTAWGSSVNEGGSDNYSALKLVTNSNSDWLYDAYGVYDPDNDTEYASESVRTYREAPNYLDVVLNRKSKTSSGASLSESNETVYRFSEAGVMYPGAYEPMRPAGIEVIYRNKQVFPGGFNTLTDYDGNNLLQVTSHGIGDEYTGDIRLSNKYYIKVMRTGFYAIHCGVNMAGSGDAALWMVFESNDVLFHSQGGPRIHTDGLNSNTVKFFNKGDKFSAKVVSGNLNQDVFNIEGPRITIVRIA